MRVEEIVSQDPEIVSGAVVFAGTRVPADTLFQYLAGGETLDEFLDQFPTVERAQAEALLHLVSEDLTQKFSRLAA